MKSAALMLVALVVAGVCVCGCGCDRLQQVDKQRFPSISMTRPLGTSCGPNDSASVKRAGSHPLGPTGGWYQVKDDVVDYNKTMHLPANELHDHHGTIEGYVKFDKPGYLQARSYDDVYGDVYCGWSPTKLALKPTNEHVFVALSQCSMGDGGLDQITEVGWFPEGSKDGTLVFSTAHPVKEKSLTAAELYMPQRLGNEYRFDSHAAFEAIREFLKKKDIAGAKTVISDSLKLLNKQTPEIDAATQKQIPLKTAHLEDFAMLHSFDLGMSLGQPDFEEKQNRLGEELQPQGSPVVRQYQDMQPLYAWLNDRIEGKDTPLPTPDKETGFIAGHDIRSVEAYLENTSANKEEKLSKLMFSNVEFWIAVKHYLNKDLDTAATNFRNYFSTKRLTIADAFEIGAAARFEQLLEERKRH